MAITETRPPSAPPTDEAEPDRFVGLTEHDQPGVAGFLGTGDHRTLGLAYVVVSIVLGVVAFLDAALYTADRAKTHPSFPQHLFQVYTSSRLTLVFVVAVPLLVGLATCIVPLQVGANTVAFPRAAAMAFWGWLLGSGLLIAAFAIDGGPAGARAKAVDLSYVGLALLVVSLMVATVCIVTTVIALRPAGMWLDRVPMFSWSMVVAGSVWLLTFPALLANIVLVYVDHHYGRPSSFGISFNQWPQISWAFTQPQIYAVFIPVLGIANDVVATFSGRRQAHRSTIMAVVGAFGILCFGAYAQPSYYPDVYGEALFIAMSILVILPVLGALGGWTMTLRGSKPLLGSPLLFVLGAALVALLATAAGALVPVQQLHLHDAAGWSRYAIPGPPYFDGHFLLVVSATTLGALGGVLYWAPKLFGRLANDGVAKLAALVGVVGGLVAGIPLLVYGFGLKSSSIIDSAHFLNGTSALGSALVAAAVVLVLVALVMGRRDVGADAWGRGQTLEWTVASPAPAGGFGPLDRVVSPEPALDRADAVEGS
ncbi:MAG TPA: cbb3-type cytochrome c oxidase subunit I [Acidimicrobiales bacterium]|nr:cbb3-type cytochrome c oxidase subunit I [Acidimicrobiales bacterium]